MATNRYFQNNYNSNSQQNLVEQLAIEAIQLKGIDVFYLPRELQNADPIYGEDPTSTFTKYYEIEMLIKTVEGFGGDGDFLSKFGGMTIKDTATLVVSRSRFEVVTDAAYPRPREGDLIFFPLAQKLYEIKFVEHENPFYQLGKLYTFDLKVQLFEYNNTKIKVGIPEVDAIEDLFMYSFDLLIGAGSGVFVEGETITQASVAVGKVVKWDSVGNALTIKEISGAFTAGGTVVGATSGASYVIASFDTKDMVNDPIADNKNVDDQSEDVVDNTERDPFSKGRY